jgi:hypothetical protein
MGCNFSISFNRNPNEIVKEAERALVEAGGKFEGTDSEGTFSLFTPLGNVRGSYQIADNTIQVVVNDKPMLVGCNRIENVLRKYLAG